MAKIIRNKKGAIGHLEVVLSFVIFISFISFLLIVFNPLKMFSGQSTTALDLTEDKIIDKISTELIVNSVKIEPTLYNARQENCFSIPLPLDNPVIVKDGDGVRVNAANKITYILFAKSISTSNPDSKYFYKIYSAYEFIENIFDIANCYPLQPGDYILGVTRTYDVVSYTNLSGLFEDYEAGYGGLKDYFKLNSDFNIEVRDSSGAIMNNFQTSGYTPKGIDVLARNIPIEILYETGELKPAILNIRVWD